MYADGMIFKDDCIVVPKTMRQEMLTRIHEGHFGVKKCRSRARMTIFWPGMNADISGEFFIDTVNSETHSFRRSS